MKFVLLLNFIFLIFLLINKKIKYRNFGFFVFFLILFFVSIRFKPLEGFDLNVYYNDLNIFRDNGFIMGYKLSQYNDYPIISLFFYLCSFFPNHYLPGFSAIIFYGIAVYLLDQLNVKNSIDKTILIVFILTSINYLSVINGIRNMLCYALLALALYLKSIDKREYIFPLLLSIGVHSFAIIFIFMYMLKDKFNNKIFIILLLTLIFIKLYPNLLISFELIPFIGSLLMRIRFYVSGYFTINSLTIYNISVLLSNCFVYSYYRKNEKIKDYFKFYRIIILILPITIICGTTMFNRIIGFMPMLTLALVPHYEYCYISKSKLNISINFLLVMYIFILFLFLYYSSYSSMIFEGIL